MKNSHLTHNLNARLTIPLCFLEDRALSERIIGMVAQGTFGTAGLKIGEQVFCESFNGRINSVSEIASIRDTVKAPFSAFPYCMS
jgi:hypothetical protein